MIQQRVAIVSPWVDHYKSLPQLPLYDASKKRATSACTLASFGKQDPAIAGFTHNYG